MNSTRKIALIYLMSLSLIIWGFSIGRYEVFPYAVFEEIMAYGRGGEGEDNISFTEKLANDMAFSPSRLLYTHRRNSDRRYQEVSIPNVNPDRDRPLVYQRKPLSSEFRVIYGTFDFIDEWHGALLLNASNEVVHTWTFNEQGLAWDVRPKSNKSPHGFEILPDGSIIVTYDGGSSIQKYDWCGKRIWATQGFYHHSINRDDNNTVWSLEGWGEYIDDSFDPSDISVVKLDVDTGQIVNKIALIDVMGANPDIDILGLRQHDSREKSVWQADAWHPNDVEPLSMDMAENHEQFLSGDLLVSIRSLNLIFVFNPDTLKIKWWRAGLTRRQHDPDWQPSGFISVYDNNMHRGVSRIKGIDPKTFDSQVLFDGEREEFYSSARGKHQILENGNILITIPLQGRVLEVDPGGDVIFEFINSYDMEKNRTLYIAEARAIAADFFEFDEPSECIDDRSVQNES